MNFWNFSLMNKYYNAKNIILQISNQCKQTTVRHTKILYNKIMYISCFPMRSSSCCCCFIVLSSFPSMRNFMGQTSLEYFAVSLLVSFKSVKCMHCETSNFESMLQLKFSFWKQWPFRKSIWKMKLLWRCFPLIVEGGGWTKDRERYVNVGNEKCITYQPKSLYTRNVTKWWRYCTLLTFCCATQTAFHCKVRHSKNLKWCEIYLHWPNTVRQK